MDLAIGAKQTWVMMDLLSRDGHSKLVRTCTYPLTGLRCVKRVYTDLATFDCTSQGLRLVDAAAGLTAADLSNLIGFAIR